MSDALADQIAARIKELREAHGLSIRALARKAGLPPELVSRSERGESVATVPSIAKICAAVEIDLPTFFAFDRAAEASELTAEQSETLTLIATLPRSAQQKALRGLRMLLKAGSESDETLVSLQLKAATGKRPGRRTSRGG